MVDIEIITDNNNAAFFKRWVDAYDLHLRNKKNIVTFTYLFFVQENILLTIFFSYQTSLHHAVSVSHLRSGFT